MRLLGRVLKEYERRSADLARGHFQEMGAPIDFALDEQVASGFEHLKRIYDVLQSYELRTQEGHVADRA